MDPSSSPEMIQEPLASFGRKRLAGIIILSVVLIAAIYFVISLPADRPPKGSVFTISDGESLKDVVTDLSAERYVRSSAILATLVTALGGEHHISPGDYSFDSDHTVFGVAEQVAFDIHHLEPIKVTFPEGEDVTDIATLLSVKLPLFDTATFKQEADSLEGYLFPETYFFYPKTSPEEVISSMQTMFAQKTAGLFTAQALGTHTESQVIIMASIVEKEAHGDDDRATIAGILWNRIALGMPLDVDATVAYANGVPENDLQKGDFSINSPYNTYLHKGLPPGPIANPGLPAIMAALDPAQTPYLYYLHDSHGTIHYAKTYAQHLANIKKYLD